MAERLPAEAMRSPWRGASGQPANAAVATIRLQRAEVEASLAYRRAAKGSEDAVRAWRRLATLRERRRALMPSADAAHLPPLPPAPTSDAPSAWQKLRRRLFGLW